MAAIAGVVFLGVSSDGQAAAPWRHCPDDPNGAYVNVRVRGVSCRRAERILHRSGHGYGFRCYVAQHGPNGVGFPADKHCRRGTKRVVGDIFDGQSSS